jgi:hypothetical protein
MTPHQRATPAKSSVKQTNQVGKKTRMDDRARQLALEIARCLRLHQPDSSL